MAIYHFQTIGITQSVLIRCDAYNRACSYWFKARKGKMIKRHPYRSARAARYSSFRNFLSKLWQDTMRGCSVQVMVQGLSSAARIKAQGLPRILGPTESPR